MKEIKIAMVGFGAIGQSFAKLLLDKEEEIKKKFDTRLSVVCIATKTRGSLVDAWGIDLHKALTSIHYHGVFDKALGYEERRSPMELIQSMEYDVLVELTPMELNNGQISFEYIKAALKRGKHAVTANKATVAWAYKELKELAIKNDAMFMYEATVMDGMPIFNMRRNALDLCEILEIKGILNKTTNYILDSMKHDHNKGVKDILVDVKKQAYAEDNPVADLEGHDAAAKVAVLANVLMGAEITPEDVEVTGITNITPEDVAAAEEKDCVIKLLCRAFKNEDGSVTCKVAPEEVPKTSIYSQIEEAASVLTLKTDVMGALTFVERAHDAAESTSQSAYGILSDVMYLVKESK